MPMDLELNLPANIPELTPLAHDSWKKGVITLLDKSRIPRDALVEMQNRILVEDGIPQVRYGVDWYGTAPSEDAIDGAGIHETAAGVPHLLVVAGGVVYRSVDNGDNWDECTGATLTAGEKVYMVQSQSYTSLTTGVDNIIRYDGTTTLVAYTAVATPGAITVTESGSGVMTGTGYHQYYKVSAVNAVGFTLASAASADVQSTVPRTAWTPATDYVTLSISAVANALRYDWYVSQDGVDYYYLASTVGNASTTFRDDNSYTANTNILEPEDNTTQGPKVTRLEQIGGRLWGVGDTDNPWRVWWSGDGGYAGYFSSAYNGGYIDIMKGSQFRPVRVVDYRDGRGTPYATVWCKSADGRGCIWQISLEEVTISGVTGLIATAYRLPGSRGTDAPDSVVNVLNDYMFLNTQAFYNLGTRQDFQNLLDTAEASANIRPTVKQISTTAAPKVCAVYHDALVMFSVPFSSEENNTVIVYDTERKAWIPEAFTIGFERFLPYVELEDGERTPRLLAWKPGDTRLSQISRTIQGDYGVAFNTSMTTGLYPVSRDRFEFMLIEEGEIELSRAQGDVHVELLGIERSNGYTVVKEVIVDANVTQLSTGWSYGEWSTNYWSDIGAIPEVYTESSLKRYFRVYKELNAYQWRLTTDRIDADFLPRVLQVKGTVTRSGKPRSWRLT